MAECVAGYHCCCITGIGFVAGAVVWLRRCDGSVVEQWSRN